MSHTRVMLISGFNYVPEQNYDILVNLGAVGNKKPRSGMSEVRLLLFQTVSATI